MGKISKPKKRKKVSRKITWRYFTEYFKLKHKGEGCVQCGGKPIMPGHVIPQSAGKIYWYMESDCFPQCATCNCTHNWNPGPYTQWFIKTYGIKAYDRLVSFKKRTKPYINLEGRKNRYIEFIRRLNKWAE